MNCEWSLCTGRLAMCVLERIDEPRNYPKKQYFTCQACRDILGNTEHVRLITDDSDLMMCYEVLET